MKKRRVKGEKVERGLKKLPECVGQAGAVVGYVAVRQVCTGNQGRVMRGPGMPFFFLMGRGLRHE